MKTDDPNDYELSARKKAADDLLKWLKTSQLRYQERSHFKPVSDFGLYKHLISNVIRWQRRLEAAVEFLSKRSLKKIDLEALVSLMIGLVQLNETSKVETYAAINESVELVKKLGKPHLKGFVNANLRRYLRERKAVEAYLDKLPTDISTSHDKALVQGWEKQFGKKKTRGICIANNCLPEVQVVLNPGFDARTIINDLQSEGFELFNVHDEGFSISNPEGLFDSRWAMKGGLLVQDRSFQLLNQHLRSIKKDFVLDACAAPGGKAVHLEWQFRDQIDTLVTAEIDKQRIRRLRENLSHFQCGAWCVQADSSNPPFRQVFDLVICDAPCSGTGTIRKHPEIKWIRHKEDFLKNQKIQIKLLESLAAIVKPGGHLLYVTCSLEAEENEQVVKAFIANAANNCDLVPLSPLSTEDKTITKEGVYQVLTSETRMGAFAALFRKKKGP